MTDGELNRAISLIEEGRFEAAVSLLERMLESRQDDPDLLLYLGMAYLQVEKPERAIEVLTQAEEQVEDHCILSLCLGRAFECIGDYEEAEHHLRKAMTLDPNILDAWIDLSKVLFVTNRYCDAALLLEDAVSKFPEVKVLHMLRAMSFYRLGDYTQATQEWRALYELDPNSLRTIANYAFSLLAIGRTEEAVPLVEKARELYPDEYRSLMIRAELAFKTDDMETAERLCLKAYEEDPGSIEAISRLAVINHTLGNSDEAADMFNKARELIEKDPSSWQRLGDIHQLLNRHDELIQCLIEASKHDAGSAAVWICLAKEYMKRDMSEDAEQAWLNSFRLRGYVKLYCNQCNEYFKVDYDSQQRFDVHSRIECIYCDSALKLPESLADI